ncbi:methionine adenosyltransferase [Prolixibacter denitrificans]|uniref:S-adenosylmethionine synthase n=1 Tax=Prolixibacter denitrificans TaxID=1541063 RepID=A0A2P8CHS6_9BACT|nr:methionine adenosyltransferase [Prolixibacter denitrificans]PSK84479.1 S-adenosylmethionine synthetase [Prolixibacter denitrificans]GET20650.1 S-adenosylmethionine synthase [Prolixibacter denitrificans]
MGFLFTSESVSEGHPDKVADQISDALLDALLAYDPDSKVAIETLVTTGQVIIAGEVKTQTYIDVQKEARDVIARIGYTKAEYQFDSDSCGILTAIHEQSPDINRGVDREDRENQGAGDQGMMFGYACKETDDYMPLPLELSHRLLLELAEIRREGKEMTYLRPDSKSQVTIEYNDDNEPLRVHTIVVSTQHDDFDNDDERMLAKIKDDVRKILIPRTVAKLPERLKKLFDDQYVLHVNPTGKFVIGGPNGDTGLTGRKIIVDTYGGKGAHGGGAFSGKDPSKVDRSAAYAARHIAKNLIAADVADEILVQLAYAIGVAQPVNIYVNTYGRANVDLSDSEIAEKISEIFDLRPFAIEKRLKLRNPIYEETAAYGHMGRTPRTVVKNFESPYSGKLEREVELFTWEKLDYVEKIREHFML